MSAPYCEIYGLSCGDKIQTVKSREGGLKLNKVASPGREYGSVYQEGRSPRVFPITGRFLPGEEVDLELFMQIVNSAPRDSKIYPWANDRFAFIEAAQASASEVEGASDPLTGSWENYYQITGEVTSRDPWLYGPQQGISYTENVTLPRVSGLLTNDGHREANLNYLLASGDYQSSAYCQNLSVRITPDSDTTEYDQYLLLCSQLMRDDLFELGWRDGVKHSYYQDLRMQQWAETSMDLMGKTSGGTQSPYDFSVTLQNGDYLMIPFRGPLPLGAEQPLLESWIKSITGTINVMVAYQTNLSDMASVTSSLVAGYNAIRIPANTAATDVAIGIQAAAGAGNSVTLMAIRGTVKRYVAPSIIPKIYMGKSYKLRIEGSGYLKRLAALIHNQYYY